MPINNSFTTHHQSLMDNDPCTNIAMENKENKLEHELSPKPRLSAEDVARVIWEQWMIIRRLADINSNYDF